MKVRHTPRRRHYWCSMNSGTGKASGGPDDNDNEEDDDFEEETVESLKAKLREANNEGKRRRLENKSLKRQLRRRGGSTATDDGASERLAVENAVLSAVADLDLTKDQRKVLKRVIDRDALSVDDDGSVLGVDEAIDDAMEEFDSVLAPPQEQEKLPAQGARHNGPRRSNKQQTEQELRRKYSSLRN